MPSLFHSFNKSDWLILPTIIITGLILTILFSTTLTNPEVIKDKTRHPLSQIMVTVSILGTFFSVLLIKLNLPRLIFIPISISFCMGPLLIAFIQYKISGFYYDALVFELGLSGCFSWCFLLKLVSSIDFAALVLKTGLPMVLCIFVSLLLIGVPIYTILAVQDLAYENFMILAKLESFTLLFLISFAFLGIYIKYYYVREEDYDDFQLDSWQIKYKSLNSLPGVVVYLWLIGVCVFCVVNILKHFDEKDFSSGLYLNLIYLVTAPLMVFIGTVISRLEFDFDLKLNILTVVFGLVPTVGFLALYLYLTQYQNILQYFVILPPFFTIFWAYLSTVSKKIFFNWMFLSLCIFIAFPVGFLLPFGLYGTFSIIPVYTILALFLLFPLAYSILSIKSRIQSFLLKDKYEKMQTIKKMTCYNTSLFTITILFILSEFILIYMYFTSDQSSSVSGAILAMLLILCLLYTMSSITMQVKLTRDTHLKLMISLFIVLSIFIVISGILYVFLAGIGENAAIGCVSACISCVFLLFITVGFLQFKYANKEYAVLIMVICNLFLWIFVVLPLGVALPSALSRATTAHSRNKIIGVATVFLGVVFMVAVSIVSILYNIYQKKIEREQLAIKCCREVCMKLKSNRIRCDYYTSRQFYGRYDFCGFNKDSFSPIISNQDLFTLEDSSSSKYYKKFVCSSTDKPRSQNTITTKKLTVWEMMNCFDKSDYDQMNENEESDSDEEVNKEVNDGELKASGSLQAVKLDEMEVLSNEEFTKIRAPGVAGDYSFDFKEMHDLKFEQKTHRDFKDLLVTDKTRMQTDRSFRQDWLEILFQLLSNAPDSSIQVEWMSEATFLSVLRYGGVTVEMLSDKRIKLIYYTSTIQHSLRPLSKSVFIELVLQDISNLLFPTIEPIKREIKLVVDYLYTNLLKNFSELVNEIEQNGANDVEKDPFRKNLIKHKPKDIICSDRKSIVSYKNISMSSSGLFGENSLATNSATMNNNNYKMSKIYSGFLKKGKKCTDYFAKQSRKLENLLKKLIQEKKTTEQEQVQEINIQTEKLQTFPDITQFMITEIDSIKVSQIKAQENKKLEKISLSVPNLLSILTKFLESIQLSSIGLKKQISWNFFQQPLANVSDSVLIENSPYFAPVFWVCFSLALVYVPVAWKSRQEIILNKFAKDTKGSNVRITTAEGLRKYYILIIGSQFYMFILKSQLAVFACDINQDPPVLWNTNIVCYESLHIAYFFSAIGCLFVYYPIATFIYPMLQFNDSKLEIKFETTFVVILSQTKLIITAITVFLPYQEYLVYQLGLASFAIFVLFVYFVLKRPCLAIKVNIWMSGGYFIAFLTNFMGLINLLLGGSIIINIIFFSLIGITIIVTTVIHCKSYKSKKIEPSIINL